MTTLYVKTPEEWETLRETYTLGRPGYRQKYAKAQATLSNIEGLVIAWRYYQNEVNKNPVLDRRERDDLCRELRNLTNEAIDKLSSELTFLAISE